MLELYGSNSCPYTRELRESLELKGEEFIEYDVEADPAALGRMQAVTRTRGVPVLIEDGRLRQSGWQGRMCMV
jgi:glutaredoxin 3